MKKYIPLNVYLLCTFLALVHVFTLTNCAKIIAPTGGPKDTLAPVLASSNPKFGEVNVKTKIVKLTFNENIAASNLRQELIISPQFNGNHTNRIKGNKLFIEFEKPLPDSSTIFLSFRNSIVDITEKQPVKDLKLAFSTGPVLDTLGIIGIVKDWLTSKPVANSVVGLWLVSDTLSIAKQKPQYISKTNEKGSFSLENVKAGNYELAAILDKNGNGKWNGKSEPIAFEKNHLLLKKDTAIDLIMYTIDEESPRIQRVTTLTNGQVEIDINEGLSNLKAFRGKDSLPRMPSNNAGNKFTIFTQSDFSDSLKLRLLGIDSSSNRVDTSITLSPRKKNSDQKLKDTAKVKQTNLSISNSLSSGVFLPAEVKIFLNEPLPYRDSLLAIHVWTDKDPKEEVLFFKSDIYRTSFTGFMPAKQASKVFLCHRRRLSTINSKIIKDDTLTLPLLTDEKVGLIRGSLARQRGLAILELLDSHGATLKTLYNPTKFELTGLPPDSYTIRITLDANGNKKRDNAVFSKKQLGEIVIKPSESIQVKANWEVEVGEIFPQ